MKSSLTAAECRLIDDSVRNAFRDLHDEYEYLTQQCRNLNAMFCSGAPPAAIRRFMAEQDVARAARDRRCDASMRSGFSVGAVRRSAPWNSTTLTPCDRTDGIAAATLDRSIPWPSTALTSCDRTDNIAAAVPAHSDPSTVLCGLPSTSSIQANGPTLAANTAFHLAPSAAVCATVHPVTASAPGLAPVVCSVSILEAPASTVGQGSQSSPHDNSPSLLDAIGKSNLLDRQATSGLVAPAEYNPKTDVDKDHDVSTAGHGTRVTTLAHVSNEWSPSNNLSSTNGTATDPSNVPPTISPSVTPTGSLLRTIAYDYCSDLDCTVENATGSVTSSTILSGNAHSVRASIVSTAPPALPYNGSIVDELVERTETGIQQFPQDRNGAFVQSSIRNVSQSDVLAARFSQCVSGSPLTGLASHSDDLGLTCVVSNVATSKMPGASSLSTDLGCFLVPPGSWFSLSIAPIDRSLHGLAILISAPAEGGHQVRTGTSNAKVTLLDDTDPRGCYGTLFALDTLAGNRPVSMRKVLSHHKPWIEERTELGLLPIDSATVVKLLLNNLESVSSSNDVGLDKERLGHELRLKDNDSIRSASTANETLPQTADDDPSGSGSPTKNPPLCLKTHLPSIGDVVCVQETRNATEPELVVHVGTLAAFHQAVACFHGSRRPATQDAGIADINVTRVQAQLEVMPCVTLVHPIYEWFVISLYYALCLCIGLTMSCTPGIGGGPTVGSLLLNVALSFVHRFLELLSELIGQGSALFKVALADITASRNMLRFVNKPSVDTATLDVAEAESHYWCPTRFKINLWNEPPTEEGPRRLWSEPFCLDAESNGMNNATIVMKPTVVIAALLLCAMCLVINLATADYSTSLDPMTVYHAFVWKPLSWVIERASIAAIATSTGEGESPDRQDLVRIVLLLLVDATIGLLETVNANSATNALMDSLAPKAKAKRDGRCIETEPADPVPGSHLFEAVNVSRGRPSLPGPSLPVNLKVGDPYLSPLHLRDGCCPGRGHLDWPRHLSRMCNSLGWQRRRLERTLAEGRRSHRSLLHGHRRPPRFSPQPLLDLITPYPSLVPCSNPFSYRLATTDAQQTCGPLAAWTDRHDAFLSPWLSLPQFPC